MPFLDLTVNLRPYKTKILPLSCSLSSFSGADASITCTDKPTSDDYYLWLEADACVTCQNRDITGQGTTTKVVQ